MYKGRINVHGNLIVNYGGKGLSFDNFEFEATIRLENTTWVRIGDGVETPDFLRGKKCTLFATDLMDIIERRGIEAGGEVSGRFCFCKRGSNYGIQLAED